MNDINNAFGKGSVTRLGSAGGALVYVLFFHVNSVHLCLFFSFLVLWNMYVIIFMCAMYLLVAFVFSPNIEISITPLECWMEEVKNNAK